MPRESGFYWVRFKHQHPDEERWEVAEYFDKGWWASCGDEDNPQDKDIRELGPRVFPPKDD